MWMQGWRTRLPAVDRAWRPSVPDLHGHASVHRRAHEPSPGGVFQSTGTDAPSTRPRNGAEHGRPRGPHHYYGDDGPRRIEEDTHTPNDATSREPGACAAQSSRINFRDPPRPWSDLT